MCMSGCSSVATRSRWCRATLPGPSGRRLKLMLAGLPSVTDDVVATIRLTDECGMPLCARAGPPALTWSAG